MRLLVDMQGAQSASRNRGIGRYTRSLLSAMLDAPRGHEVWLLLNGRQREEAAELREIFGDRLPPERIVCWDSPGRQGSAAAEHDGRRAAAEYLRAGAIAALDPDLLLLSSLFEGWSDDSVTAWPDALRQPPTAAICYDFIPLLLPELYLSTERQRAWYGRRLVQMRRMDGLLAISESSRQEAVSALGVAPEAVANLLAGVSPEFRPALDGDEPAAAVAARYGLRPGYVFCVGAVDPRKNVERLIRAFALLPPELRARHALVVTVWNDRSQLLPLRDAIAELGVEGEVVLLDRFVPERDLPGLYRAAAVAVSPSFHEGFGLSAAEAMACGVPSIASDRTSLPEVVGRTDALFDPHDADSIAARIRAVLEDPDYATSLVSHGLERSRAFRWPEVGTRAWDAIEAIAARPGPARERPFRPEPRSTLAVVLAARAMDDRTAAIVCGLARHYAVELVSEHRVGGEHWATAAFPLHSPARLAEAEHGRLLVLLGDDGDEAVAACRLLDSYPGILVATGRPVAVLLREAAERSGPAGRDAAAVLLELSLGAGGWHAVAAGNRPDDDAVEAALERRLVASWRLDALPADGAGWGAPIEAAYRDGPLPNQEAMLRRVAAGPMRNAPDHELLDVARPASLALRREHGAPRRDDPALFLDVSTQAQYDAGTGIQRVVREVVRQLAENGLPGRRVEPVIAVAGRFDLARRFGMRMFGLPVRDGVPEHADREVPVRPGDVYVALDLCLHDIAGLRDTLRRVRAEGGRSFVVVYDLLPVLQPDAFPFPVREAFPRWLEAIARDADGLVCISRAVADELLDWLREHGPRRRTALRIGWFHLGADFLPLAAAGGEDDVAGLDPARPSFLMVGTIEPRKGHGQVLSGFDALWERGVDAALVVVGKAGWMTGELVDRLREHPERGRRLFWIENGSDALVSRLYRSASALLMASRGEGFGLPVVEAARAGLPVISRRLPVCVEVAGEGATWFDGEEPGAVAAAVEGWLAARAAGRVPDPKLVRTLSWAEAGRDFARAVVDGNRYAEWGGPES